MTGHSLNSSQNTPITRSPEAKQRIVSRSSGRNWHLFVGGGGEFRGYISGLQTFDAKISMEINIVVLRTSINDTDEFL